MISPFYCSNKIICDISTTFFCQMVNDSLKAMRFMSIEFKFQFFVITLLSMELIYFDMFIRVTDCFFFHNNILNHSVNSLIRINALFNSSYLSSFSGNKVIMYISNAFLFDSQSSKHVLKFAYHLMKSNYSNPAVLDFIMKM